MVNMAMVVTTAFEVWIHIASDNTADKILLNKILDTIWYTLVTILYVIVIIYLIKQLNKINESDLYREKISIIRQFILFLIGYTAWTIYITVEYFNTSENALFVDGIIHAVAVALWDILPITYMLLVHHRTFRSMIKQLRLSTNGDEARGNVRLSSNVDEIAIKALMRESNIMEGTDGASSPQNTFSKPYSPSQRTQFSIQSYDNWRTEQDADNKPERASSMRITAKELNSSKDSGPADRFFNDKGEPL